MALTFLQQQNKLSRLLGDSNTGTSDAWPLADRKLEINRGELHFAIESRSYLGKATGTVASQAIDLPTGFIGVHMIVVNNIVMTSQHEMPLADYERYINSGEDRYYFWVDTSGTRKIHFIDSNTNNQAYVFYYFRKPTTDLSADADESPFQDEYREASVFYAASQLLPQSGKLQLASYYEQKYREMAAVAKEETEKHILSVIRAYPDMDITDQYDKDIQGIGQQW